MTESRPLSVIIDECRRIVSALYDSQKSPEIKCKWCGEHIEQDEFFRSAKAGPYHLECWRDQESMDELRSSELKEDYGIPY